MIGFAYTYCKVNFGSEKQYYYRTFNRKIKVGDHVIVPYSKHDVRAIATVVGVGLYKKVIALCPVHKTKTIIKKTTRFSEKAIMVYNQCLYASLAHWQKMKQIEAIQPPEEDLSWIDRIEEYDALFH